MKKNISALFLGSFFLISLVLPLEVAAQTTDPDLATASIPANSILPMDTVIKGAPPGTTVDCLRFLKQPNLRVNVLKNVPVDYKGVFLTPKSVKDPATYQITSPRDTAMSCGIKTGRIDMWLIPYYIVRVIDFALLLSGILAVLFIVIGGYLFIVGSYTDEKEKGKKTIMYALLGLALSLLSYTVVNLIMLFATS